MKQEQERQRLLHYTEMSAGAFSNYSAIPPLCNNLRARQLSLSKVLRQVKCEDHPLRAQTHRNCRLGLIYNPTINLRPNENIDNNYCCGGIGEARY